MTSEEWLLAAAKNAKSYLARAIKGDYIGQHEDIRVARELAAAIEAVEQERAKAELFAVNRQDVRR